MSSMLHPYADDDEDGSFVTFYTTDDDDSVITDMSVGQNSSTSFGSVFVNQFTGRVDDRSAYSDNQKDSLWVHHCLSGTLLRRLRKDVNGSTYLPRFCFLPFVSCFLLHPKDRTPPAATSTMSTMLHPYSYDDEDGSFPTFYTTDDDDSVITDMNVGQNNSTLFRSGFVHRFTGRVDDCSAYRYDQIDSLWTQHYLRGTLHRRLRTDVNGSTYLAELQRDRERALYAIKIISKDHGRKLMERNVLKSLDHPFLPKVYVDVDTVELSFLIMDCCQGGDLRALLRRSPLCEEAAKFYAAEVLLAMEYLHAHGIIHRDLKPENVLIRADGHIMLSGFDHARKTTKRYLLQLMESEEEGARGRALIPEATKGQEHDAASDWYTYGMFLYELLFGMTPIPEQGRITCFNFTALPRLKFPHAPAVSPAARDLLRRLLKTNPKGRLGHKGGAAAVRGHAFFDGIDFAWLEKVAARRMRPPELPIKFQHSYNMKKFGEAFKEFRKELLEETKSKEKQLLGE